MPPRRLFSKRKALYDCRGAAHTPMAMTSDRQAPRQPRCVLTRTDARVHSTMGGDDQVYYHRGGRLQRRAFATASMWIRVMRWDMRGMPGAGAQEFRGVTVSARWDHSPRGHSPWGLLTPPWCRHVCAVSLLITALSRFALVILLQGTLYCRVKAFGH